MKKNYLRKIAVIAVFSAISYVLMLLEFPLPFIIPGFIKFDFSEIPALIVTFSLGPFSGVCVCLIKNLLHLPMTSSAGVGEMANFLLGAVFVGICGIIYKYKKNRRGAFIASLSGAFAMALLSVIINYTVVYPAYVNIYGMPMEAIVGMYQALLPYSDTLIKSLLIFNLPFTLFKGIIDSLICFLVYKKISPVIKGGKNS